MQLLDTSQFRYFIVSGQITIRAESIDVWWPGHCLKEELPEGEAAFPIIAERCRLLLAQKYEDSAARWVDVKVTEHGPPSQLVEGRIEDLF